jgi:hypothetical protein
MFNNYNTIGMSHGIDITLCRLRTGNPAESENPWCMTTIDCIIIGHHYFLKDFLKMTIVKALAKSTM